MAVWSIILSNIKKKKGNFIGVFILILIIAVTVSTILSAYLCGKERYDIASEESNSPYIVNLVGEKDYDSSMEEKLKEEDSVKAVKNVSTLAYRNSIAIGSKDFGDNVYLYAYEPEIFSYKLEKGNRMDLPQEGEIYLPKYFKDKYNCSIGDEIKFTSEGENVVFTIGNFFEDTAFGSGVIGMKRVYIGSNDYNKLYNSKSLDFNHIFTLFTTLEDQYKNSHAINEINQNTGIQKYGSSCFTLAQMEEYTFMMPDIMSAALLGFSVLLLIISLVVIAQSISASIEMEYKTYGILKAMGFSNIQLRIIILLEYVIASIAAMIFGVIISIFMVGPVGNLVLDGTGLFWVGNIKYKECLGVFLVVLLIISLFIVFMTRKITKISPVRAIAFGNAPVYFSSRLNFSLGSFGVIPLSVKLGFKQVITHMKQSIVLIAVITILTFFSVSMYSLGQMLTHDKISEMFNPEGDDLSVFSMNDKDEEIPKIESEIEKYSDIEKKFKIIGVYKTVDDKNIHVTVTDNNDNVLGEPKEGRNPKYDNEILITKVMEEELEKTIGDKVTIEDTKGNKENYIIVGINQSMSDLGKTITMLDIGMKRLVPDFKMNYYEYCLAEPEKTGEIIDNLQSIYGKNSSDFRFDNDYEEERENFDIADDINIVAKIIFYISTVIVGLIVVLVCNKGIRKIKKDIGILKSQGFTDNEIRCQISIQFLIISLLGSVLGTVLNVLLNDKLMSMFFKYVGITDYVTRYDLNTVLVPILAVTLFTLVSVWLITIKVKKITPKNLIVE